MRFLPLAPILAVAVAVPAAVMAQSSSTFVLPAWMDIDYSEPVPGFDDLLGDAGLPRDACPQLLATTDWVPFESTREELEDLATTYDDLGRTVPALEAATSTVAASLRTAAERGADRQALLSPWFDRAAGNAIRQLGYLGVNHCGAEWRMPALGPTDRLLQLAEHDHPDSTRLEDVASWSMSMTGSPTTVYWAFGYLGDEPVELCQELSETLASAGFTGTELTVHDADLEDRAEGLVGDVCRGS